MAECQVEDRLFWSPAFTSVLYHLLKAADYLVGRFLKPYCGEGTKQRPNGTCKKRLQSAEQGQSGSLHSV